jgi:hypothetical protein
VYFISKIYGIVTYLCAVRILTERVKDNNAKIKIF